MRMKADTNQLFKELLIYIKSVDYEAVEQILKSDILDINEPDSQGETALHHAIRVGSNEIVNILLKKGAQVEARDDFKATPLYLAAYHNYLDGAKALISSIEDPTKRTEYVNCADNKNITSLHVAIFNENGYELINLLLKNGANPNAVAMGFYDIEGQNDLTPLHLAVLLGDLEAVTILVSYNADLNKTSKKGQTPSDLYKQNGGKQEKFDAAVKKGQELYQERQAEKEKATLKQTTLDSVAQGQIQSVKEVASGTAFTKGSEPSNLGKQAEDQEKSHSAASTHCSVTSVSPVDMAASKEQKIID